MPVVKQLSWAVSLAGLLLAGCSAALQDGLARTPPMGFNT